MSSGPCKFSIYFQSCLKPLLRFIQIQTQYIVQRPSRQTGK